MYTCREAAPEVMIGDNSNADLHVFPAPQELRASCRDFELVPAIFLYYFLNSRC